MWRNTRCKKCENGEKRCSKASLTALMAKYSVSAASSDAFDRFDATVRHITFSDNSSYSNGKKRNMSNGIQVSCTVFVANPKPLLPGRLKPRIVAFAFVAQSVNRLKIYTLSVYGKPVIIRDCDIFGAAGVRAFLKVLWLQGQS